MLPPVSQRAIIGLAVCQATLCLDIMSVLNQFTWSYCPLLRCAFLLSIQPSHRTVSACYVILYGHCLWVLLSQRSRRLSTPCSLKRVVVPKCKEPEELALLCNASTPCCSAGSANNPLRNPDVRFHEFPQNSKFRMVWVDGVLRKDFGRPRTPKPSLAAKPEFVLAQCELTISCNNA